MSSSSSARARASGRRRAARSSASPEAEMPETVSVDPEAPVGEAAVFYAAVWDEVRRVPYGEVTTYGWIAKRLGHPRHSRMVGQALKWLPARLSRAAAEGADPDTLVPWHRVLSSSGKISLRGSRDAEERQARLLRNEGVEVTGGGPGTGEGGRISLTRFGYFPPLPAPAAAAASSDDSQRDSEAGPSRRRRTRL